MKKLLIYLCVPTLLLVYSCQKENLHSKPDLFDNLPVTTQQAIEYGSLQEVKQKYLLLDISEKQELWEAKLSAILINDESRLTKAQNDIVVLIKEFATSKTLKALFSNPMDGEKFVSVNLPFFEQHFSTKQLFLLIEHPFFCRDFSIFNENEYLSPSIASDKQKATCSCYWSISCMFENVPCMTGECLQSEGCGIFGTADCTGTCR